MAQVFLDQAVHHPFMRSAGSAKIEAVDQRDVATRRHLVATFDDVGAIDGARRRRDQLRGVDATAPRRRRDSPAASTRRARGVDATATAPPNFAKILTTRPCATPAP